MNHQQQDQNIENIFDENFEIIDSNNNYLHPIEIEEIEDQKRSKSLSRVNNANLENPKDLKAMVRSPEKVKDFKSPVKKAKSIGKYIQFSFRLHDGGKYKIKIQRK